MKEVKILFSEENLGIFQELGGDLGAHVDNGIEIFPPGSGRETIIDTDATPIGVHTLELGAPGDTTRQYACNTAGTG